jgi:hypothetical protein
MIEIKLKTDNKKLPNAASPHRNVQSDDSWTSEGVSATAIPDSEATNQTTQKRPDNAVAISMGQAAINILCRI